ncbi:MAG: T9SS type A sorting domain-containing protein [Chitinophagales bacterium]
MQTASPQTVTLTNLTANGAAVNVTAFFTSNTSCTFTQNNAFTAPVSCAVLPCSITAISAGTQSACVPATNTYTQQVTVTYSNPPSGTLNVNGQTFAVTASPQTVTLSNLTANGAAVNVTAFFTSNTSCTFTQNNAFTAPVSCAAPTCSAGDVAASLNGTTVNYCPGTSIDLLTDGNEVIPTGEEYIWVFINATDTILLNTGGNYSGDVNADLVAAGGAAIPFGTYLVYALVTDAGGTAICEFTPGDFTINVLTSTDPACLGQTCSAGDVAASLVGTTVNYCPGTSINLLTDGNEFIPTGEDYFWVFINASDTVLVSTGGNYSGDINADLVATGGTAIPFGTYLVYAFVTDAGGTAICEFTPGDFTLNVLASTDPACANPCNISAITAGTQSTCNPATNTYTQQVTLTYSNAPGGTININGQTFAVGTSPQSFTLVNLPANGNPVNLTAFFTNNTSCTFSQAFAFTAPVSCASAPCSITAISAGTQSACVPATDTYTQQVIITYANAPSSGTLNVNGQTFAVTTSPQTVTLSNLNANGAAVDVTAFFTSNTSCSFTQNSLFTAPVSCFGTIPTDTLVVMMFPNGAGTIFIENDVITSTPFTGIYPSNDILDISVNTTGSNVFDYWRLNNLALLDFSPSTSFLFIDQDTLFAYFNGATSISNLDGTLDYFSVYPSLINTSFKISFEVLETSDLTVQLFGIDGKLIENLFQQKVESGLSYSQDYTLDLASGLYIIKVSNNLESFALKVIKM